MEHSLTDLSKMEQQLYYYNKGGMAGLFHSAQNAVGRVVIGEKG